MEKKLKQVLDCLDEKETDMLLNGIESANSYLNEDRIRNMVFEKTGVNKVKRIPWRMYSIVAAAACLCIVIGITAMNTIGGKKPNNPSEPVHVADNDEDDNNISQPGNVNPYQQGSYGDGEEQEKDENESGKDGKSEKDEGIESNNKKPEGDNITVQAGNDVISKVENMSSEEVEAVLKNSVSEIDMSKLNREFDSLEDMINKSDYIVRGVKVESSFKSLGGEKENKFVLVSNFMVSSILWDNTGNDLKDRIKVNEGIVYDYDTDCYTHIGGYSYMKSGSEYILFLNKEDSERYSIAGTIYGKVPMDKNESILNIDNSFADNEDIKHVTHIVKEARTLYSDDAPITNEVIDEEKATPSPQPTDNITENNSDNDTDEQTQEGENVIPSVEPVQEFE